MVTIRTGRAVSRATTFGAARNPPSSTRNLIPVALPARSCGEEDGAVGRYRFGVEACVIEHAAQFLRGEEVDAAGGEEALESAPVRGLGLEDAHDG